MWGLSDPKHFVTDLFVSKTGHEVPKMCNNFTEIRAEGGQRPFKGTAEFHPKWGAPSMHCNGPTK